jgi:uridine monophosphate synthetase
LIVNDVVVVLDREQGARKTLEGRKLRLHSIFTITQILDMLEQEKMVEKSKVDEIRKFISSTQTDQPPPSEQPAPPKGT